jgi:hypothetical protein
MNFHGPDVSNAHMLDGTRWIIIITCNTWNNLLHLGAIILQEHHVTRYFNSPGGPVVVSIGVRVLRISNKYTLYGSSFKFTELSFVVLNKAFASKDTNIHDIRLVTGKELVWGFVVEGTEEEPVGVVDGRRDGFSPKVVG